MQEQIERDIKTAMLAGDKKTAETLKVIKSALLYEAVALGARETGLSEEQCQKVLVREAKKRAEAAQLYKQAGETERTAAELAEKAIIDAYLPAQLSEAEVTAKVQEEVAKLGNPTMADMGKLIGAVRANLGPRADGALIAKLVKEAIAKN